MTKLRVVVPTCQSPELSYMTRVRNRHCRSDLLTASPRLAHSLDSLEGRPDAMLDNLAEARHAHAVGVLRAMHLDAHAEHARLRGVGVERQAGEEDARRLRWEGRGMGQF